MEGYIASLSDLNSVILVDFHTLSQRPCYTHVQELIPPSKCPHWQRVPLCHFPQKGNYDCGFFGTWTAVGCSVTFVQDGRGTGKVLILPNSVNPTEMFSNIWNLTRSQAHLALVSLNCWAQTDNVIHLLQSRFPKTHPNLPWWELFDVFVFVGLTPSFSRFTSWSWEVNRAKSNRTRFQTRPNL